jgi:23S rRNA (cytosine1962-C5)-methyltransferase
MKNLKLVKGRDRSVLKGHPWLFSGAIAEWPEGLASGEIVRITSHDGAFLGYGFTNRRSQIAVRMLEYDEKKNPDDPWFKEKVMKSVEFRRHILSPETDSCRLVFGESDGLPGLIVDRFAKILMVQISTAGMDLRKKVITEALEKVEGIDAIYERSDTDSRKLDGLEPSEGWLRGPREDLKLLVRESGWDYEADLSVGQKTGFYFDQRENRKSAAAWAEGRDILDCFSYTGSFAVHCLKAGGRSVLRIDSSAEALAAGERNIRLNALDIKASPALCGNAFEILRKFRDEGRKFGMIVLDPPKLAPTRHQAPKAMRAYKDINLLAMKLLEPEGILVSFSCSSGITRKDLQDVLRAASEDSGRRSLILEQLSQPSDHPIPLFFPEAEYLKGFICRIE